MGKLTAIVLIALLVSFALSSQARTSRPNILFVMLDIVIIASPVILLFRASDKRAVKAA